MVNLFVEVDDGVRLEQFILEVLRDVDRGLAVVIFVNVVDWGAEGGPSEGIIDIGVGEDVGVVVGDDGVHVAEEVAGADKDATPDEAGGFLGEESFTDITPTAHGHHCFDAGVVGGAEEREARAVRDTGHTDVGGVGGGASEEPIDESIDIGHIFRASDIDETGGLAPAASAVTEDNIPFFGELDSLSHIFMFF